MKKSEKLQKMIILAGIFIMLPHITAVADTGWQPLGDGRKAYIKNDEPVTGSWVTQEGERYYLGEDGICIENQWFSLTSAAKEPKDPVRTTWYYAGEGGKVYRSGWMAVNGYEFYFNGSGGAIRGGILNLDGKKYYIHADTGKEHCGWFSVDATGSNGNPYTIWRYAKGDGALLVNGWHDIDGRSYYFDANGANYRKRWFTVNDKKYYANEDGVTQEAGWFSVSGIYNSGIPYTNWYYLSEEKGQLKDGFFDLDGNTFYFDTNGLNYRKRWYVSPGQDRYYFGEDGALKKDGWFLISTVNAETGAAAERWYYAGNDGKTYCNGIYEIDGKSYYFDANSLNYRKRWLTDKRGRKQYFLEDGTMPRDSWFSVSGTNSFGEDYTSWYYADGNGYMLTENTYTLDGKEYQINKNGTMFTGWKRNSVGEYTYYGEDGAKRYGWQYLPLPAGWVNDGTVGSYVKDYGSQAYFYFDPLNGGKLLKSWSSPYTEAEIEGRRYCVDHYGLLRYGWAKLRSAVPEITGFGYYMPEATDKLMQGERAVNCWIKTMGSNDMAGELSETWYYFDENGQALRAAKDRLLVKEMEGDIYAFDYYGRTQAGFIELEDGSIYYFDKENKNAAARGICQADDGNGMALYKFGTDGKAVSGVSDECLYYRGRLQAAARDKGYEAVKMENGKNYLVDTEGRLVKNQEVQDASGGEWAADGYGNVIKSPGSRQYRMAAGPKTLIWDKD